MRVTLNNQTKDFINPEELATFIELHSPTPISQAFKSYYQKLYTSDVRSPQLIHDFLTTIPHPKLEKETNALLDLPLTLLELTQVIQSMVPKKAPGPDGLSVEFYKEFQDEIAPFYLQFIAHLMSSSTTSGSFTEAIVIILLKPGKDKRLITNYRPLSLINVDAKIFAKLLSNRLQSVITKLISPDQCGFINGRFSNDNTQTFSNIIARTRHNQDQELLMVGLDAEKAFDRIELPFLFQTLHWYGFSKDFIKKVQILYSLPTTRTYINGSLSSEFKPTRVSGYKLNTCKTEVMPINCPEAKTEVLSYSMKWSDDRMKYLGVYFGPTIDDTVQLNIDHMLGIIKTTKQRPHVEVNIYWKSGEQKVQALVDTGAEASIIYGNPKKFRGPRIQISGLGGKIIQAVQTKLRLKIGQLPIREYTVLITEIPEYIIGIDILKGLTLQLSDGIYSFGKSPAIPIRSVVVGKLPVPIVVPISTKIVNMKQYRILGGHEEITNTIQDLVKAGVIKTVTSAFNNPVWPVHKADGSWRMTVDYRELNKHTPPLSAAVQDMITLVEQIQSRTGTWYAVIDLANAFFSIPIVEQCQEQFAFTWQGRQYTFTRLPQGYLHSPTFCHKIIAEHLDNCTLPEGVELSHYIDDILIQGNTEKEVADALALVVETMRQAGWEINPKKVQGPAQTVVFLGIKWSKGCREVIEKVKQKIVNFPSPQSKKQTQAFIGLFGFWRQHIPHLGQILSPLYKITRKKYDFVWTEHEEQAFQRAKEAIQQAMNLWPLKEGPVELQVSVQERYANWSLWQKQAGRRVLLGFWNRTLPETGTRYTPFERQLLACYWALVATEQLTIGHEVMIRPEIPIMTWIMSDPKTHRIGHAQEQSIIKWKWYIQQRAKSGLHGVTMLHEKVFNVPTEDTPLQVDDICESPIRWGKTYQELTETQQQHTWFTDGSSKYQGQLRHWKGVSFNPVTKQLLTTTGKGESSQYAELYAVWQAIRLEQGQQCHIFTDSWAVANGMTTWMMKWKKDNWTIHNKEVWGARLWQDILEWANTTVITVYHVDAHVVKDTLDTVFNSVADSASKLTETELAEEQNSSTPHVVVMETDVASEMAMATWAHQKSGHLGEKGTIRWAHDRGIHCTVDMVKTVISNCHLCKLALTSAQQMPPIFGKIARGRLPGQIWQIDYIGPLPLSKGCQYVCTMVDTYSGLLVAYPCRKANQENTIRALGLITLYYGHPLEIQSDRGTHFTGNMIRDWINDNNVQWRLHVAYHPQASGLIERMNGLLKTQLKRLGYQSLRRWREHLTEALQILNNRPIASHTTPLNRMLYSTLEASDKICTLQFWTVRPGVQLPIRATDGSAGLDVYCPNECKLDPQIVKPIQTGLGVLIPKGYYGQICPQSSLALKGVTIMGGVIDSDYRGEIGILLLNLGKEAIILQKGDRVAQLITIAIKMEAPQLIDKPLHHYGRSEPGFGAANVIKAGPNMEVYHHSIFGMVRTNCNNASEE
uniref:ribonuclease H n=1 Tax=Geotrypetes seraphini TaxID=260995 RepID=A0A6P8S4J7_GEOSA|nr:uncharacterized protein LOC117365469 [Geotrypetes seraphini]